MAEEKKQCIHCGACTGNCDFLRKYQMDIGNEEKVKELAYHCFLCGKCGSVCPAGIDGREVFLQARRSLTAENGGKVAADGYDMLVKEKQNYIFRNYKNVTAGEIKYIRVSQNNASGYRHNFQLQVQKCQGSYDSH